MAASSKKVQKATRVYVAVATVAFSGWLIVVVCRLIILAGSFVTQAVSTVLHSVPFIG
jgi:hypothetical protein